MTEKRTIRDAHNHAANDNERVQTRFSIFGRWMLLVSAAAIPIVIAAWPTLSAVELAGIASGIATWTGLMIRFHIWRLLSGEYGETSRLTFSAMVLAAVEWLILFTAPSIALLVMYSPSAMLIAKSVPEALTNIDFLMAYLVTVVCGAQALACLVVIWRAFEWLHYRLNREGR